MSLAKSTVELEGRTEGRSFIKAEKRVGPSIGQGNKGEIV